MSKKVSKQDKGPVLPVRSDPYPNWIDEYGINTSDATWSEFRSGEQLYELMCEYVSENAESSFRLFPKANVSAATKTLQKLAKIARDTKKRKDNDDKKSDKKDEKEEEEESKVKVSLGLGVHTFKYKNETVYALHQSVGQPQAGGWSCKTPTFYESLVIFVKGKKQLTKLKDLCTYIIELHESKKDNLYFTIYRFNCDQQYWRQSGKKIARDMETVILPEETLKKLTNDIERFLDEKSVEWYFQHGIPYKRSYLFYGVPGSGKSSMVQALAAKYDRNLCFLQPTHPKMTDDAFKACIQSAPGNSLIVLEDIDALFHKDRSKKHQDCPLTFSGLLNGLDGVGNPDGQIFILTTNFVDRLDEALIRSGRVDLHIGFPHATDDQLKRIFLLFYPNDNEYSIKFLKEIRKHFQKGISMAAVQQHFIQNMFVDPKIVVEKVSELGERLDVEKELNEKTILKEKKPQENDVLELFKKAFPKTLDDDLYKTLTEQLKKVCQEENKRTEKEEKEKEDSKSDDSFVVVKDVDVKKDDEKEEAPKEEASKEEAPKEEVKDEPAKEEVKQEEKPKEKEIKKKDAKPKSVKGKDVKKVAKDGAKKDGGKKDAAKKDTKKTAEKNSKKKDVKKDTKDVKKGAKKDAKKTK